MTMKKTIFLFSILFLFTACADINNGERGVVYKPWSGGLDKDRVYEEGTYFGISWIVNDMIEYNVRQQTLHIENTLLDKNGMDVDIKMSVMFRPIPSKIGYLHEEKGPDYVETYCMPVAEGALKDILGKYAAQDLLTKDREAAQSQIKALLTEYYAKNYIQCDDVILSDIDLPEAISKAIENKQVQDQKNLLAEKRKVEEQNLAAAKVAKAEGDAKAKVISAKAEAQYIRELQQALASNPQYVELKKIERWSGEFGSNNVFGGGMPFINVLGGSAAPKK